MAVAVRSVSHDGVDNGSGGLATTKPAGLAVGDFMLLFIAAENNGGSYPVELPSGWTQLASQLTSSYGTILICYRWATSDDVNSWSHTVESNGGTANLVYVCYALTGVDSSDPVIGSAAISGSAAVYTQVTLNYEPSGTDDLVVVFEHGSSLITMNGYMTYYSNPSSWTEDCDWQQSASSAAAARGTPSDTTALLYYRIYHSASSRGRSGGVLLKTSTATWSDDDLDGSHRLLNWAAADDLDGSHRVMVWAAADDLDGSHRLYAFGNDDLDGSHRVLAFQNDDLDGSHRLMVWAAADDLDGSHRVLVWSDDDLDGSHHVWGWLNDDLAGSHLVWAFANDDLAGSHRVLVWSDDDLAGSHALHVATTPAVEPKRLYVPQLALLLDDENSVPVDLVAEGADAETIRFTNNVVGGHGRLSVDFPHGPSALSVNGLHRGMDAALYDRGHKLWQGVVLTVDGDDTGDYAGTTTVECGGFMELADLDRSFEWTWVDAEYGAWFEVEPPYDTVEHEWTDAYSAPHWDPADWSDAQWDVRTDGELYIGTVRGSTYRGDAFYRAMPRKRLAYMLDRRLYNWPSGSYDRIGAIAAFRFDWRCTLGSYFRLHIGSMTAPWADGNPSGFNRTSGTDSGDDEEIGISGPCVVVQLMHYRQYDTVAAGERVQLLHPRVLVRPDGPGTRSWSVGDDLPRLDQCMSDVMMDADGVLATSVEADVIGDELDDVKVSGPTRREALDQLAEYDEDDDETGQPLEYGIWDDRAGIVRRRDATPTRKDEWLAIDTRRDDVDVQIEYEDSEAPDYVEVRYEYRRTNLIRHGSPAAADYWSDRGYADDVPYDWQMLEGGVSVVEEDGQRRWKLANGSPDGRMVFPKAGTYPVCATQIVDSYPASVDSCRIPFIGEVPLRFQFWAKGAGCVIVWYQNRAGDPRGSDTLELTIDGDFELRRYDWYPDPTSSANELFIDIAATTDDLTWRNAQLYYLIPDGVQLSAWYPNEPTSADASVATYDLPHPATIWQARNSARRFYSSFARGVGKGTITARGILHDMRGRDVPVSRIRGGYFATIVDDPRCTSPLYVSSVECSPSELESVLGIGGDLPAWSERPNLIERRTFGQYADWRGFRPIRQPRVKRK